MWSEIVCISMYIIVKKVADFSHNYIKTCRFFTIFNLFADFLLIRFQHFFLFFKRFIFFSLVKLYFIDKKGRLEWINSEIRGRHSLERRMSYQTFINVRQRQSTYLGTTMNER